MLKVRPHTKSGGVVNFRSDIRKVGGGGGGGGQFASGPIRKVGGRDSLQVRYEKWGGGGGDSLQTKSGGGGGGGGSPLQVRYTKSGGGGGGGASPLRVRYLCLAHRKYLHVPTYVLPRYTSHARANELIIHAGKG